MKSGYHFPALQQFVKRAKKKGDDGKALHPLLFSHQGFGDISIISKNMLPHLSLKDYGIFARVSCSTEKITAFLRLLHSIVNAEPESYQQEQEGETRLAAIVILKRHPELLFRYGSVEDPSGRTICGSPYQLFLGTGDTWALKEVHKEIIPNIKNGENEAATHFQQQFPNCPLPLDPNMNEEALYDERNKKQVAQVKDQLQVIVEKIKADPCTNGFATSDETTQAVAELCQIYTPKQDELIHTGLYFPLGILREIYNVYDLHFEPWSGEKLTFFSCAVVGSALRASTAVDGQCYKEGLKFLDMDKGPDRQDGLFCSHPKGIPPKLAPIKDKLGRTMFLYQKYGNSCFFTSTPSVFEWYDKKGLEDLDGQWWWVSGTKCGVALKKLWKTKAENLSQLILPCEKPTPDPVNLMIKR